MANVQAIKTTKAVEQVTDLLLKHKGTLHADIWKLGVNLPFRISDLLSITTEKARQSLDMGDIRLKEKKTRRYNTMKLNSNARLVIKRRLEEHPNDTYLFQSPSNRAAKLVKPISRQAVHSAFSEIGDIIGVNLGTHSMRKTRGRISYDNGEPIEKICFLLNHKSPDVTMLYLGITQDEVNSSLDELNL